MVIINWFQERPVKYLLILQLMAPLPALFLALQPSPGSPDISIAERDPVT